MYVGPAGWTEADNNSLDQSIGTTRVDLVGDQHVLQYFETNIGNFVTEAALSAYPEAEIAFINAGTISLSGNILADSMPAERFLRELQRNSGALCPFRISGAAPKAAPLHTVSDWNGEGRWLQIASFAFEHVADNALIANLRVREVNYWEPS